MIYLISYSAEDARLHATKVKILENSESEYLRIRQSIEGVVLPHK